MMMMRMMSESSVGFSALYLLIIHDTFCFFVNASENLAVFFSFFFLNVIFAGCLSSSRCLTRYEC